MRTFDEVLRESVARELEEDLGAHAARIEIDARDGAVTLSGCVLSDAHRRAAVRAAERVYGVLAVADVIGVDFPASGESDDVRLAAEIASERRWSALIPKSVEADVSNGRVTLRGEVERDYQRAETVRIVSQLAGSASVSDLIERKPREVVVGPKPKVIEQRLDKAIEKIARID